MSAQSSQSEAPAAPGGSPSVTVLDNRSTPCAVGLIRANDVSATLPLGTTMTILSRDRFAPMEIALWAARSGHSAPVETRAGTWPFRYRVFSVVLGGASGS